jgi:hypothetical protein
MTELIQGCAYWVAVLFVVAGVLKMVRPGLFAEELQDYGVPAAAAPAGALVIPALELTGAGLTFSDRWYTGGLAILAALLVAFTAITFRAVRQGRTDLRCACFGASSQNLSPVTPLRSALMAAVVLLALLAGKGGGPGMAGLSAATIAVALGVSLLSFLKMHLTIAAARI